MDSPSEARPRNWSAADAAPDRAALNTAHQSVDGPITESTARVNLVDSPLPQGMRDVLPLKAVQQARVGSRLMRNFELCGYGRVWLPLFEYEHVLRRAATEVTRFGANGLVRFVEPESGEVVALRSDMTPQIARVVSTRYRNAPRPVRLCYQGSVLRRRRERARTASQVIQAGAELVGMPGPTGDLEVLEVMIRAVQRTGLKKFVLDIGHAGVPAALLEAAPLAARAELVDALNSKDRSALEQRAKAAGLTRAEYHALATLTELSSGVGPADTAFFRQAEAVLGATPAAPALRLVRDLVERVAETGLVADMVVDLGEVRGFDYYTGVMFQILADGPGEPIAAGGRYDTLYDRFGLPNTGAAGFAVDVHNLCWALERANVADPGYPRLVADETVPVALLAELRDAGVVCCICPATTDLPAFAQVYQFEYTLSQCTDGWVLSSLPTADSITIALGSGGLTQVAKQIQSRVVQTSALKQPSQERI